MSLGWPRTRVGRALVLWGWRHPVAAWVAQVVFYTALIATAVLLGDPVGEEHPLQWGALGFVALTMYVMSLAEQAEFRACARLADITDATAPTSVWWERNAHLAYPAAYGAFGAGLIGLIMWPTVPWPPVGGPAAMAWLAALVLGAGLLWAHVGHRNFRRRRAFAREWAARNAPSGTSPPLGATAEDLANRPGR